MGKQFIKAAGLKVTAPRVQILEFFEKHPGEHFTADDLYRCFRESDKDIGLATIYRVLNQFESAGLVIKHQFENGQAMYELETGEHHDHMVDVESGEVVEFFCPELEKLQERLADEYGFELVDHSLVLYVKKKKK